MLIRKVLENKIAFAAIVLAFALALGVTALYGNATSGISVGPAVPALLIADGPSIDPSYPLPPDPGGLKAKSLLS